jgi:hypothetical protein
MWYKCAFISISLSPCKARVTHSCHFGGGFVISSYVKICSNAIGSSSPKFDISTIVVMVCLHDFPCALHKFQNKFCTSFLLLVVTFCCHISNFCPYWYPHLVLACCDLEALVVNVMELHAKTNWSSLYFVVSLSFCILFFSSTIFHAMWHKWSTMLLVLMFKYNHM